MRRARFAHGEAGAFVCGGLVSVTRAGWGRFVLPLALGLSGCGGSATPPSQPAARIIESSADSLMAIPGVVGLYEGVSGSETVIRIMLAARSDSLVRRLPKRLGGYRVELEVTGRIEPMRR